MQQEEERNQLEQQTIARHKRELATAQLELRLVQDYQRQSAPHHQAPAGYVADMLRIHYAPPPNCTVGTGTGTTGRYFKTKCLKKKKRNVFVRRYKNV